MNENKLFSRETKEVRAELQNTIDNLMKLGATRSCSIAVTKLQEAKMWLGQHLGELPGNEDLNAERDREALGN